MSEVILLTPPSHTHRTAEENVGIGYLASCLRMADHSVTIIDGWLKGLTVKEIVTQVQQGSQPDLIGISCYRYSLDDVHQIVQQLRLNGYVAPIVAGGFGPTYHDKDFLCIGIDYIVRGEAEQAIVLLADALNRGGITPDNIAGLSWIDPTHGLLRNTKLVGITDLDALPFPARDTIAATIALKNPVHIVTSRGCMANCLFCSVASFQRQMKATSRWRQRSVVNIVDEIRDLYERFGVTHFKIVDDSFIEPPRDVLWVEQFANELARHNLHIHFRTQVRADRLSEPLIQALASVGWFATSVGIENGSPTALERMNKSATLADNLQALALLKQYGIYVQMGMILFDHETSLVELQENLVFLSNMDWVVTKGVFTEMYAAEGTPFTGMLKKAGKVVDTQGGNHIYTRADASVATVYAALKQWHRSHSMVYDHAINPISAPKVLSTEGYRAYHVLCRQLYRIDMEFFRHALEHVQKGAARREATEFVQYRIDASQKVFNAIEHELRSLDSVHGIKYEAEPNPFLGSSKGAIHVT